MESQPAPLLSRESKILKVVSDFKYRVSWANSTERGIEVRKSLAWKALNDMSSIWSSNLSRDLKIRVFQATIESVLLYGCEGWSLTVTMEKSLNRNNTRMLAHVLSNSWRDRVTNAELYGDLPTLSERIGFRTLGLARHCHCHRELPTSQLVLWRPTHGHLRRDCPESTFIDTLILSIIIERYYRLYLLHWSGASVNESGSNQITRKARLSVFSFSFSFLFTLYTLFTLIRNKNIEKITSIIRIFNKIHLTLSTLLVFACYVVIFPIRFDLSYFL